MAFVLFDLLRNPCRFTAMMNPIIGKWDLDVNVIKSRLLLACQSESAMVLHLLTSVACDATGMLVPL